MFYLQECRFPHKFKKFYIVVGIDSSQDFHCKFNLWACSLVNSDDKNWETIFLHAMLESPDRRIEILEDRN